MAYRGVLGRNQLLFWAIREVPFKGVVQNSSEFAMKGARVAFAAEIPVSLLL